MKPEDFEDVDDEGRDDLSQDNDDDGYIACPHCGETMLEAADYCPSCDRWMTTEDIPAKRNSWWIVAVIVALIAMILFSIMPI